MAANQELIRDMNYHKILETIIREGCISRADLAKRLGLTKATVSSQVQNLLDDGLVEEAGVSRTSKGRHPIQLSFRGGSAHALSFDIGLERINLLLSDLLGQDCYSRQFCWNPDEDELLPLLYRIIDTLLGYPRPEDWPSAGTICNATVDRSRPAAQPSAGTMHTDFSDMPLQKPLHLVGISLAIHGVVRDNEILFTPYYNLEHAPLREKLTQRYFLPVFIENEANLSALGEKTFSHKVSNLVNISVHSGIGLGIIMDGRLYSGANGFAGEFGHTIVEPHGRPCPCGNHGCIEQYASETAILRKYNQLSNTTEGTVDDLVSDYQKKEGAALLAIEDFVTYMAIGINNIVNIFNPQLIVINSSITAYLPDVTAQIYGKLANRMSRECKIVPSTLQDTATLLGGVCLCSRNYLGVEEFCPALDR